MGVLHWLVNHERKEAFELGKILPVYIEELMAQPKGERGSYGVQECFFAAGTEEWIEKLCEKVERFGHYDEAVRDSDESDMAVCDYLVVDGAYEKTASGEPYTYPFRLNEFWYKLLGTKQSNEH